MQKCQCYYTLFDQSIPLVTVTSDVSLLTEQLWICIKHLSSPEQIKWSLQNFWNPPPFKPCAVLARGARCPDTRLFWHYIDPKMTKSRRFERERVSEILQTPFYPIWLMYLWVICPWHGRRKVQECILVILAAQPGLNGWLSCLHSFKIFWPMKPSYTSN